MWTLGNVRIFVMEESESTKQIVAELFPLREGSIYQYFGWEKLKKELVAKVVGSGDLDLLHGFTASGVSFTLIMDGENLGDYIVRGVSAKRDTAKYQTLRPDLDCEAPVYTVSLDLAKDY